MACGHIKAFSLFPFPYQRKSVLKACRADMRLKYAGENTENNSYSYSPQRLLLCIAQVQPTAERNHQQPYPQASTPCCGGTFEC